MTETSRVWFSELKIEHRFVYEKEINRCMWPMAHDFIIFCDSCFFPEPSTHWRAIPYCWTLNYDCCCWFNWFHFLNRYLKYLEYDTSYLIFSWEIILSLVTKGSSGKLLVFWALYNEIQCIFPAGINSFWILVFPRSWASAFVF